MHAIANTFTIVKDQFNEQTYVGLNRVAISRWYDGILRTTALIRLLAVTELAHVKADVASTFGT